MLLSSYCDCLREGGIEFFFFLPPHFPHFPFPCILINPLFSCLFSAFYSLLAALPSAPPPLLNRAFPLLSGSNPLAIYSVSHRSLGIYLNLISWSFHVRSILLCPSRPPPCRTTTFFSLSGHRRCPSCLIAAHP